MVGTKGRDDKRAERFLLVLTKLKFNMRGTQQRVRRVLYISQSQKRSYTVLRRIDRGRTLKVEYKDENGGRKVQVKDRYTRKTQI